MFDVDSKIANVLDQDFDAPYIFQQVLKKEVYLLPDELILDLIWLRRETQLEGNETRIYSPSKLLVLTSYGLIFAEEGFTRISEDMLGYKVQHIPYNKISDIELDVCLLAGVLKIATNAYGKNEAGIEFNTAKYYPQFEKFIEILRQKVFQS